ncbi:uncharacterized protein LOC141909106 [Tubulanus polymorphus]|uniref:uncharacterized protein LOC141909106 n=1 Tax=Tubulanus polymorphus TaxID=672921 RepID=UPI003DA6AF1A
MKLLVGIIIGSILFVSGVVGKTEVTGPATGTGDDAASEVQCPGGSFVVQCRCSSISDCDSNMVVGTDRCKVTHTAGRPKVKPIATCEYICDQQDYRVVRTTYSRNPIATCPDGFIVRSCGIYYPWSQYSRMTTATKSGNKQCTATATCSRSKGCQIQAVCTVDPEGACNSMVKSNL